MLIVASETGFKNKIIQKSVFIRKVFLIFFFTFSENRADLNFQLYGTSGGKKNSDKQVCSLTSLNIYKNKQTNKKKNQIKTKESQLCALNCNNEDF